MGKTCNGRTWSNGMQVAICDCADCRLLRSKRIANDLLAQGCSFEPFGCSCADCVGCLVRRGVTIGTQPEPWAPVRDDALDFSVEVMGRAALRVTA